MTDISNSHWLETYKSLITLSIEGFKFSALVLGVVNSPAFSMKEQKAAGALTAQK